jgi:transcriptional regulator with XRE-family HTH domain
LIVLYSTAIIKGAHYQLTIDAIQFYLKFKEMNIGSAIKSIRKKLSITQYELAEKCDLSQTSLSQIETGIKRPSQRTISKVCAVLDIPESIIYIVAMQESDVPPSKRGVYELVYPSIKSLALQMVSSEHINLVSVKAD